MSDSPKPDPKAVDWKYSKNTGNHKNGLATLVGLEPTTFEYLLRQAYKSNALSIAPQSLNLAIKWLEPKFIKLFWWKTRDRGFKIAEKLIAL